MSKKLYGVAINDSTVPVTSYLEFEGKMVRYCDPVYQAWRSMVQRCYSTDYKLKRPHYKQSSMQETWLLFSKFKAWSTGKFHEGHQLDKDLLLMGNTHYSEDTCLYIHPRINILLTTNEGKRSSMPLGVSFQSREWSLKKPYVSRVGVGEGNKKHLGYFATKEEAHRAWQLAKATYIEECISWWRNDNHFSVSFSTDAEEALEKRIVLLRSAADEGLILNSL